MTLLTTNHAHAFCFEAAAAPYHHLGMSAALLQKIAYVESRGNAHARNRNTNGSVDLGLMQINSQNLAYLQQQLGVSAHEIATNPCTNVHAGARILADGLRRYGNDWQAVGSYNAGCSVLKGDACQNTRANYAWKVYRAQAIAGQPVSNQPMPLSEMSPSIRTNAPTTPSAALTTRPQPRGFAVIETVVMRDDLMTDGLMHQQGQP